MKRISTQFIGGKFVPSHGQELFDLISPSSREVVGQVTLGVEQDIDDAVRAAQHAFATYSTSTVEDRRNDLQRLHDAVVARTEDHIAAMQQEYGAPPERARATVARAAKSFLNAREVVSDIAFARTFGDVEVLRKPVGVAGLITPWNSNILMICHKVASAIAAGCTVVVKPSELSALQTQVLLECFDDAGLPAGVINVVNGRGEVAGQALGTHPDVAKVSFTGSTAVGKALMRNAAETMKRVTLELGGKSAHIVLEDADLSKAIPFALSAAYMNSGQACVAGSRLLVPESRLDEVKSALKDAVAAFRVGDPSDPATTIGPMVTEKQYQRVQDYIRKGIEEGAELLVGGEGHPEGLETGHFVKPTVFVGVTNGMTIAREEIFGPVLSVISYTTEDEAVQIANDSTYGLFAYVTTADPQRGRKVAARIESGGVFVNELFDFYDEPYAPIGGFKQSGFGREFGVEGIEEYLGTQSVYAR
ncbi:aldehyde dehydrogenase family protein [Streptomyces sp. NBC_01637]|uniref:aldehyde dehydrogenase family protein n=1 Tax=unclassified Streptomyces TaxID=2593676 RepID=UPI0038695646|nr:aldehyde dehydrogenase family protein [Streptomyces sp. NBC_01653]WTD37625.1 aldehyde dehydrogenase family protein [Streptomyces sp. NBC_01643]WTD93039.1 aldehyde dehydrogenase family protein [Streptomyces sp. NBC_01637]